LRTSRQAILSKDITIRVITAPYFSGTKLEAFRGRGKEDFFASHDLEDFIAVIDGRREIAEELLESEQPLRNYVASTVTSLLSESKFLDALPGYLLPDAANQARISLLMKKLSAIASMSETGATP
ncbi:MAG TPA: hypothetical protein VK638_16405, partial [Edaphobacter sp.]|nr:hypothetical protein [Edaphobacter sp.]